MKEDKLTEGDVSRETGAGLSSGPEPRCIMGKMSERRLVRVKGLIRTGLQ